MILTASHIAEILSVSKPTAYELMNKDDFPLIRLGRSKRVLKVEFFTWLTSNNLKYLENIGNHPTKNLK
ncbi:helix-turn-helix domain-containing protein [Cytobacillus pseudoceanisediminis]|nr:helix-turn-helix domain-containing protein [Cytobacillus pseudoceanisediminis]MCM3393726.1 helix-turn-helix domain-containing protein [Cytobacillus oceanisediminis]UQX56852.1 helix-turn-helix domain-containing protein [Cytobacillus pseudoceanisediminis]